MTTLQTWSLTRPCRALTCSLPFTNATIPQPYFSAPDFNFASAKKASGNVAGLCNWAEAMCKYHAVATQVEPKIVALREAEAELRVAGRERAEVGHLVGECRGLVFHAAVRAVRWRAVRLIEARSWIWQAANQTS